MNSHGKRIFTIAWVIGASTIFGFGCGEPEEPPRLELGVFVDATGLDEVETDLGYRVSLEEARLVVENLTFAVAGEVHQTSGLLAWIVPSAHAHPGHFRGGEVTGELRGRFLLDWFGAPDVELGTATLLPGDYRSANFVFGRAGDAESVASDDPLRERTGLLRGRAIRDGWEVRFVLAFSAPPGRSLTGIPFEVDLREGSHARLGLRLLLDSPRGGGTLFDGVDFAALDVDGDGSLAFDEDVGDPALATAALDLRRALLTHDYYDVRTCVPEGLGHVDGEGHCVASAISEPR
jgi:hypothetical protein